MEVMIGIDPHKRSHTALMLDRRQRELRQLTVRAGRRQVAELLDWNRQLAKRTSGPLAFAPIEVRLTAPPACTARLPTKRELWISMASVWTRSAPPLLPALLSAKVHQRMRTLPSWAKQAPPLSA